MMSGNSSQPGLSRRDLLRGRATAAPTAELAVATISPDRCLLGRGVVCRSCADLCELRALRYRMQLGGAGIVLLDQAACTGCGECVPACPVNAIAMTSRSAAHES